MLAIRIVLPFIINTFLFLVIRESNAGAEYVMIDTLFYLGLINLVIGVASIFVIRRFTGLHTRGNQAMIDLVIADQNIKNYHRGEGKESPLYLGIDKYLKLVYIVVGVLLCVIAVILYII